jgi:hypothetical protein
MKTLFCSANRLLALVGGLGTLAAAAGCDREFEIKGRPSVVATLDVDAFVNEPVLVHVKGTDADGQIVKFNWSVVSGPAGSTAALDVSRSAIGELAQLTPTTKAGVYVLRVVAVDNDSLESDPDYVNVSLRPRLGGMRITCDGCEVKAQALAALEQSRITLHAALPGDSLAGYAFTWNAKLTRDPADTIKQDVTLKGDGKDATLDIPQVTREASLAVTVLATNGKREVSGSTTIIVLNSKDEPPKLEVPGWRFAGQQTLNPSDKVLPGDGIEIDAVVSDLNGDRVTCSFAVKSDAPVVARSSSSGCHQVLFPTTKGTVEVTVTAETKNNGTRISAAPVSISVQSFGRVKNSPRESLNAVAVDNAGTLVVAGEDGRFFAFAPTSPGATFAQYRGAQGATAIAAAVSSEKGLVGLVTFAGTGKWFKVEFASSTTGEIAPSPFPAASRALARGDNGRVFGATDKGIGVFDPASRTVTMFAPAGLSSAAVAVGRNPLKPKDDDEGLVWYSNGQTVLYQPDEALESWDTKSPGTVYATLKTPDISVLSGGTARVTDLWVGTGSGSGKGEGLLLYRDAVDKFTGKPKVNAPDRLLTQEKTITSIAVETGGTFEGDAWVVAGENLYRIARVPLPDGGGQRGTVVVSLSPALGVFKAQGVALRTQGARHVYLAVDDGLLSADTQP